MPISVSSKGSFEKTQQFLKRLKRAEMFNSLSKYGERGVDALSNATPIDSRLTAETWTYSVVRKKGYYAILWHNTNLVNGIPVAILIQYGHATGTGGFVQGQDYINPAIRPIFDEIATEMWKVVTK